jgi:transcriptional regulator with XRE-family HTH domain
VKTVKKNPPSRNDRSELSQADWKRVFSRNLMSLRKHRGYSLQYLSRLSGVPASTLSHLESGIGNPTLTTWVMLSQALRCTPEDLLVVPAIEQTSVSAHEMPVFREQLGSGRLIRLLPDPFAEIDVFVLELDGAAPFAGTVQSPGAMRLVFVLRGELEVAHSGRVVRVGTRCSLLISGSEVHSYKRVSRQPVEAILFKYRRQE